MLILGLSHIALNTPDIERSTARLAMLGYTTRFDEPDLENHPAKFALLERYQPRHHIRSLGAPGGMAIELLDHGYTGGMQSADLIPVFQSPEPLQGWQTLTPDCLPLTQEAWRRLGVTLNAPLEVFHDPELMLTFVWFSAREASGLFACLMPSLNVDVSKELLSSLRFRPDAACGLWSLLSPIPALQARLLPIEYCDHPNWLLRSPLDAAGSPCVALVARGSGHPHLPMLSTPRGDSESFALMVNDRSLKITLVRSDHGPVIELVEPIA
ncbi:hypothetical protein [Rhizobium leguminosarum]|uniref:hypothetical protein n=1 Tax=Rhizobium leguminosarum TaxID=384 RepID=UPI001AE5CCF3|nr:hypothetical protein [Rhizobium leguminosarum]MBP2447307.1 hypothetical protein [Rhizobium leguminosarum]